MLFSILELADVAELANLERAKSVPLAVMKFSVVHVSLVVDMHSGAMKLVLAEHAGVLLVGARRVLDNELALTLLPVLVE